MNKDSIISLPNKHLRQKSELVSTITSQIKKTVNDMISATVNWDKSRDHEIGVALAAIQIDRPVRVIIVKDDYDNKESQSFTVLINPQIVKLDGDLVEDFEGCLSVPNIYGKVPRYNRLKIKALDLSGKEIQISAKGFMARILQHEIDHLEGVVFVDKIKDNPTAFFVLDKDGKLVGLDYEKDIKKNSILWQ